MIVQRGYYRRWHGLEEDLAQLTPGDPLEETSKTAILRVTDMYFSLDSGNIFWWDSDQWVPWGDAPLSY